jgi:microcystin-dependent protein
MTLYKWSQTANTNATADSTCTWPEGMAPSQVNDSARGNMAAIAKYRDDIAGAITTGGASTAYTVTSYQVFDTLAHMAGQMIAFTPHTTNTGSACTLNVDGLGAKALRSTTGVELPAGTLIQGTPYLALYNNSDAAFYLHGFFGNPYNIPIASSIEYWGSTAPNSSFVFPYGQAISRTTYSALFALLSTTYGTGDGSTTFNLPDLRGRGTACLDNMGGSAASRLTSTYFGTAATALGAVGGAESQTLTLAQTPSGITVTGTIAVTAPGSNGGVPVAPAGATVGSTQVQVGASGAYAPTVPITGWGPTQSLQGTGQTMTSNNTSGNPHPILQPTILCNRIMRII